MFCGVISAKFIGEEKKSHAVSRLIGSFCVNSSLYVFNFFYFKAQQQSVDFVEINRKVSKVSRKDGVLNSSCLRNNDIFKSPAAISSRNPLTDNP